VNDLLLPARLQAALGDAYVLERELGGGGMSRLFVATERSLNRQVVIKVLPPELASEVSGARFKKEIEVAAQMLHPHIVPILAAGSGDDEYFDAFEQLVEPAVAAFEPELVLVSAGFDAHVDDPLASMLVTEDGFRELSRRCFAMAPRCAAVLEGGYELETLPRLVAAALEGFSS